MHKRAGFTLLELSVVIIVLSLILSGIMTIITQEVRTTKMAELKMKMDAIEVALQNFRRDNNRLPCPASLTTAVTNAQFGVTAATPGTCTGGAPAANYSDGSNTVAGMVPVSSLGLPDDYAFDPWGGKFTYAVDKRVTGSLTLTGAPTNTEPKGVLNNHLPPGTSGTYYGPENTTIGTMTVNDLAGNARTTKAIAIVLSHGPNGHGAFLLSGTRKSIGSNNTNEQENCECNSAATAAVPPVDTTFVMGPNALSTAGDLTYSFDDIVRYYVRAQLLSAGEVLNEKNL
jgi:prepilin-type N-terminal cleavage/methylation domain-containing protein